MAKIQFSTEQNGYSKKEVDAYIVTLQNEYNNAVEWGNELEKQLEKTNSNVAFPHENVSFEAQKVISSANEVAEIALKNAELRAEELIKAAEKKADAILTTAYHGQERLVSETANTILETKRELDKIRQEKERLKEQIEALENEKSTLIEKIEKAKELLK